MKHSNHAAEEDIWVRLPEHGQALLGLERTFLFELCTGPRRVIRSFVATKPGKGRGVRLVHLPSVKRYLAAMELLVLFDDAFMELETGAFTAAEEIGSVLLSYPLTRDVSSELFSTACEIEPLLFVLSKTHPERVEARSSVQGAQSLLWKIKSAPAEVGS